MNCQLFANLPILASDGLGTWKHTMWNVTRVAMSFAILLPIVLISLGAARHCTAEDRPNVLVILTDDQGWADIGYNNGKVYTPNLDRLASGSAVMTQHYVMPQCTPTRLALFTGRYPGRFGTTGLQAENAPLIPPGTLTLANHLQANGYETYLTGKWHMGSDPEYGPNHHGFEYSYGGLAGDVGAYQHEYRAPLRNHPNKVTWHRNHEIIPGYENGKHVTDLVTEDAIRVIKKEREDPFFLYLPYFAPHTPLDERGDFVTTPTQLDADRPGRWLNEDKIKWFNDPDGVIQREADPQKRLFLAVVHHLDDAIGRVIEALDESGQRDNTIVFFSSDNGPQVNWNGGAYPSDLRLTDFNQPIPFRGEKSQVYEGGMRVPGFVHWPKRIKPGSIDSVRHVVDWLPTIASLTGTSLAVPTGQPELDGKDFSMELLGQPHSSVDRDIYAIHRTKTDKWALRHGDWKVVHYGTRRPEVGSWKLYHLVDDPHERSDVSKSNPDVVQRLHERFLAQHAKDKATPNFPFGATEIDPSQKDWFDQYRRQENVPDPAEQLVLVEQEPSLERGFESLFNGTDLTGWTPLGGESEFFARNGSIVGRCVPGSESTYLSTDRKDFENFVFTCELFWEEDCNTGVMFRAASKPDPKRGQLVFGPQAEMEGFEKGRGWSGGIYGQSCGGYFYPLWLKQHAAARAALRKEDWNRVTISAKGNVVKTWINGVPASHWIDDGSYPAGFFSLQIHKGKKGTVRFRNLRVKELK
ncbi:MAG: sulfatase-like hydrolase/transferase [Planctomycetota bacterium]